MSDLQLGLLCIGVAIVAIVLAYNKWQEVKFKRRAEREFRSRHSDVLFGGSQGGKPGAVTSSIESAHSRIEPVLVPEDESIPVHDGKNRTAATLHDVTPSAGLSSELIDYLVDIRLTGTVLGKSMIDAAVEHLASAPKTICIEGVPEDSDNWHTVDHDRRYIQLRAGMQLVDRRGRAGRAELQAFVDAVRRIAQSLGGTAEARDIESALARADELDRFCGEVDLQVAVHIAGPRFSGTKIRALAEAAGFTLDNDGKFRRRDAAGLILFELANDEATPFSVETIRSMVSSSISLELDVPRAPGGGAAFDEFKNLAGQFATALGGNIVDDRRARLSDTSFGQIGNQLSVVRKTMDDQGISAGGQLALRLFS